MQKRRAKAVITSEKNGKTTVNMGTGNEVANESDTVDGKKWVNTKKVDGLKGDSDGVGPTTTSIRLKEPIHRNNAMLRIFQSTSKTRLSFNRFSANILGFTSTQ